MSIDLHVIATRKIKYECPKTKQWLDDVQSYELYTSDFNSEGNLKVVDSNTPLETYCALARQYWGDAEEIIDKLIDQIEDAGDHGYTIEWEAW